MMKKAILIFTILLFLNSITTQAQPKNMPRPTLAMPDMSVDGILAAMKNQANDAAKLSVVKNGIQNNTDGLMVAQELRLMNQFATDDSKLECAKFLYAWSVDYKNYDKVIYNMGSAAAQKALRAYIAKNGNK